MVRHAPLPRLAPALDFIGSTSGPLTMKWPLTSRMVSVVIALPYPNPLRRSHKRDRTPMNIGSTLCDERVLQHVISQPASDPGNKPRRVLAGFFMCGACPNLPPRAGPPGVSDSLPLTPKHTFYLFMSTTCTGGQDIHNRATGEGAQSVITLWSRRKY